MVRVVVMVVMEQVGLGGWNEKILKNHYSCNWIQLLSLPSSISVLIKYFQFSYTKLSSC